ncbi:MAG: O-methyltransferase [Verrucomicrobiales bacterium]|nr:O-methyltransferase [Verrucomicrobiales bacterium]
MIDQQWVSVDRYVTEQLVPQDEALTAALAANAAAGLRALDVTPAQGKLLHLLALIQGARTILEIGTLGGYSTIWLARALPPAGRLVTLEAEPKHAHVAQANIERAGLAHQVDLRLGPALEILPQLLVEYGASFDLVFIDADKPNTPGYFKWSLQLCRPGALIIADNVIRNGAVADPATADPNVQGMRRFFEVASKEPRVSATAIQTVGAKGYDGFALLRVKP